MTSFDAHSYLAGLADTMHASGDPNQEFYYLAGPMTGLPAYNFPEFLRIGEKLRKAGMNIISPAELQDGEVRDIILACPDGRTPTGVHWTQYMAHDLVIVTMPTCIGGIFIPGWETSAGANLEGDVLSGLRKNTLRFVEDDDAFSLEPIFWEQPIR
jgi:Domain of unknown function (DUF4406)